MPLERERRGERPDRGRDILVIESIANHEYVVLFGRGGEIGSRVVSRIER